MEAYDSEKGFKLCSKEIGQFYRTLSSENRTLVEKMAEKRLFFEGFPINWRCYGKDINFKLLYDLECTELQLLLKYFEILTAPSCPFKPENSQKLAK